MNLSSLYHIIGKLCRVKGGKNKLSDSLERVSLGHEFTQKKLSSCSGRFRKNDS